ncbi:hypothetical protein OG948_21380 [Embleya sp. NBC_00888]|uniref:hypothetical protein n=1 Tax=Embleya sp. NBC_00888 TaxID=2975960 RepID=UPI0038674EA9|nr:hypothetical protein OG948_21380 [Embleya sp. NBC_00888]
MSLIIHRCECGHVPGRHHRTASDTREACRNSARPCRCKAYRPVATPEVLPTWTPTGRPIPEITPPGERVDGQTTCSCDACRALYAKLTGAAQ